MSNKNIHRLITIPILIFFGIIAIVKLFYNDYKLIDNDYELPILVYIILFTVMVIVIISLVRHYSSETDQFIKTTKGTAYGVFFGFITVIYVFLLVEPISILINRAYVKKETLLLFEVRYIDLTNKKINFFSESKNLYFHTTAKFSEKDINALKENDIIKINIPIGLLDRPFLYRGKIEFEKL